MYVVSMQQVVHLGRAWTGRQFELAQAIESRRLEALEMFPNPD